VIDQGHEALRRHLTNRWPRRRVTRRTFERAPATRRLDEITATEAAYARAHGFDALEQWLEANAVDTLDIHRASAV